MERRELSDLVDKMIDDSDAIVVEILSRILDLTHSNSQLITTNAIANTAIISAADPT
jgi:hypothetical protein